VAAAATEPSGGSSNTVAARGNVPNLATVPYRHWQTGIHDTSEAGDEFGYVTGLLASYADDAVACFFLG
jgi:hypothetical protein